MPPWIVEHAVDILNEVRWLGWLDWILDVCTGTHVQNASFNGASQKRTIARVELLPRYRWHLCHESVRNCSCVTKLGNPDQMSILVPPHRRVQEEGLTKF